MKLTQTLKQRACIMLLGGAMTVISLALPETAKAQCGEFYYQSIRCSTGSSASFQAYCTRTHSTGTYKDITTPGYANNCVTGRNGNYYSYYNSTVACTYLKMSPILCHPGYYSLHPITTYVNGRTCAFPCSG